MSVKVKGVMLNTSSLHPKLGARIATFFALVSLVVTGSLTSVIVAQSTVERTSSGKAEIVARVPAGIMSLALAPQVDTLAAVTYKGTVRLGTKQWPSQFERVMFCNKDTLLLSTYRGRMELYNTQSAKLRYTFPPFQEPRTDLSSLPLATHGDLVAWSYFTPAITVWNTRTKREIAVLRLTWRDFLQPQDVQLRKDSLLTKTGGAMAEPSGYQVRFSKLAFSPDGKMVAAGMVVNSRRNVTYGKVGIWDIASKRLVVLLRCNSEVAGVAFSPLRDAIACVTASGNVMLWKLSLPHGDMPTLAKRYGTAVASGEDLKWSNNGRILAVLSDDKVLLLDPATLKLRHTLEATSSINNFAFTSTARHIYTGHHDGTIQRWQLPDWHLPASPSAPILRFDTSSVPSSAPP